MKAISGQRSLFIVLAILLLGACQKDKPLIGKRSGVTLDTPLSLQLDTNCMRAPNVISVNGDGLNDVFQLTYKEPLQSLSLTIINPNGTTVYSTTTFTPTWSGFDGEFIDEAGPIPYLYTVQLTTMAGMQLTSSKVLHVIRDIYTECVTADVQPLTGERLDPRLCHDLWEQMDHICVE